MEPNYFKTKTIKLKPDQKWLTATSDLDVDLPSGVATIQQINKWVNNNIIYTPDKIDSWKSPQQTLKDMSGDCEDLAILKLAMLLKSGVDPTKVFFNISRDLALRSDHAVIVVYTDSFLVLDNNTNKILKDTSYVGILKPIFSYQAKTKWIHSA